MKKVVFYLIQGVFYLMVAVIVYIMSLERAAGMYAEPATLTTFAAVLAIMAIIAVETISGFFKSRRQ